MTVLDIRTGDDRAQWSIPGSLHIDAYHHLRQGSPGPLADAVLPADVPVVTICNMGVVSQVASQSLQARGFDALFLQGGMKSWSLAWNTATVPLADEHAESLRVIQVRRTGKGCLSYLLGSGPDAVVIDASLPPHVYQELAGQLGLRIRFVLDTHIHADHLSRSRALSEETGAALLLPHQGRASFPFTPLRNGDKVTFGKAALSVLLTQGHTLESTTYVLEGMALFTGDTLFLSGVGRPDLHANPDAARQRAGLLYHSLAQLLDFAPGMLVLPGHASEPIAFDGVPLTASVGDIRSRLSGWLSSEQEFTERILARIPETPPNFTRIVECNEAGILPEGDPADLEAGANRCAVSS